jgi:hypothetical protein
VKIDITWQQARKYLNVATDLLGKIPSRGDNALTTIVKILSIVDSFDKKLGKENPLHSFFDSLDADSSTNQQFVDLFFSTPLKDSFKVRKISLSDYVTILIATDAEIGTLYFIEYNWGAKPEPSSDFWLSPGFDFEKALARLWSIYERGIHIGLKYEHRSERPRTQYRSLVFTKDPIIGSAVERLDKLIESHRQAQADGFPRTYLFYGKQGVGKSTFATRLAQACGKRTLRVDARGLTHTGANDLSFLINGLKPDFLILDDIDRITEMATALPMLLETLTDLKERHPSVTAILTANDVSAFDPAVIRPGRVDRVLEFEPPNRKDREIIFRGYFKEFGIESQNPDPFVKATDGLTAAYIREVVIQIKNTKNPKEVLDNIKIMKALAEKNKAPASPGGVEPGGGKQTATVPSGLPKAV